MPIALAPQYTQRHSRWTTFKALVASKALRIQFDEDSETCTLWGYDGPEVHLTEIWKGELPYGIINGGYSQEQNDADKADFEANYKPTANLIIVPHTADGSPIISPTTQYCPEDGVVFGVHRVATIDTQNIWDTALTTGIYLQGGGLWVRNASDGDYGELAIMDKDDVLGLFTYYGLTVGVDVLELRKHVRKLYFPAGDYEREISFETRTYIPAGLYLREIYKSTAIGGENPILAVHYQCYEV